MTLLHGERLDKVAAAVCATGAASVLDLGCGAGQLLIRLAREPGIVRLVGLDLSAPAIEAARRRIARECSADEAGKIELVVGSMLDPDPGLFGFDVATLVETIEHLPPDRLSGLERAVFMTLGPRVALVTTPNADFNGLLGVPGHRFRDPEHRFEWGREKFRAWAEGAAGRTGYRVDFADLPGTVHATLGGPTQMATFTRR